MTTKQTTIGDAAAVQHLGNTKGGATVMPHVPKEGDKPARERGPMTVPVAVRRINLILDLLHSTSGGDAAGTEATQRAVNAVRAMRGLA